jgi:hypothetical protein
MQLHVVYVKVASKRLKASKTGSVLLLLPIEMIDDNTHLNQRSGEALVRRVRLLVRLQLDFDGL